jgi:hypothetical protein
VEAEEIPPTWTEIADGDVTWRFDRSFFTSRWTCIWGRGCLGIHDEPTPELGEGCCSIGAELGDEDEAMHISAMAAMIDPSRWANHGAAVFKDETRTATNVVDGACVFFNRPGFSGGAGCALHLEAVASGESPTEWKPSVCWQLPIKVDWQAAGDDREIATVRAWSRADWGDEGETMAWCCTEGELAYVGDRPVVESLGEEIEALVGPAVYVELRRRLA